MKLAVLGATGASGQQVVQEALERGHTVTALVRNPAKLTVKHDHLKVVTVDIYDPTTMVEPLSGQDAVLSCLGTGPSWFSLWSITFFTDTARHIVTALRQAKVTRFIFMSAWYTKYDPNHPFFINWVLKPMFLGQSLKNSGEMEDYLATECPDIDYTAVRAPQLTNTDSQGHRVVSHEGGQTVPGYPINKVRGICRRDVAKFMLDITEKGEFVRKCVAICSGGGGDDSGGGSED